jgi:hypothetical protein
MPAFNGFEESDEIIVPPPFASQKYFYSPAITFPRDPWI